MAPSPPQPLLEVKPRAWLAQQRGWLLLVAVVVVYAPSLFGGFLGYDDPWLIDQNPVFREPTLQHLGLIWSDFSRAARLSVGAEYLPVRDTSVWLESLVHGLEPHVMRCVSLAGYLGALALLRGALHRSWDRGWRAELALLVFALHPLHVESVAWLSGRKDVLALLFVSAALFVHAGPSRRRVLWVPVLLLLAHFSKAQTTTALGLLLAQDLLAKRQIAWRIYAGASAAAVVAAFIHVHVGRLVGITAPLAGGSRLDVLLTFGEVLSRYLHQLVWPTGLSIVYDVPTRTELTFAAALGLGLLLTLLGFGSLLWRRGQTPVVLAAWLWLVVPLVPVSQVLFPLQNRMADRYLIFSVMGLGLLATCAVGRAAVRAPRATGVVVGGLLIALGAATFERSRLFADSALLFADATERTQLSTKAPFLLGSALEERHDVFGAERAYREAVRRAIDADESGRRATNNLARLYARQGRNDEAYALLTWGRKLWPQDPKLLYNLATITARRGDEATARQLFAELRQRFPAYRPGQRSPEDFYRSP
jgi:tetratricopeptide (TPR) repeat protein